MYLCIINDQLHTNKHITYLPSFCWKEITNVPSTAWWNELTEYNVNYSVQRCNWWIKNIHYTNIAFQSISKLCTNFSFKLNHLHLLKQIIKRSISKLTIILVVIFDVSFHTISNVLSNVSKINFICTLNEKNITLSEQFQYQILKS